MDTHSDSQAMTEVALGLAMAFFALMILAMVSMSVPTVQGDPVAGTEDSVEVQPSADEGEVGDEKASSEAFIIVFYQGRYFDTDLKPLALSALPSSQLYILAMSPNLSFENVLHARAEINRPNLRITELDATWLQRLEYMAL